MLHLRNLCLTQGHKDFLLYFLCFIVLHLDLKSILSSFSYKWCKVWTEGFCLGRFLFVVLLLLLLLFANECLITPALFDEKINLFCLYNPDLSLYPCQNQLTIMYTSISALCPVPLIYLSKLMPIPRCLDYYSVIISLEVR